MIIVLRRHEEQVEALTAEEWNALHATLRLMTARLRDAFAADHFNYAFLQNQERHVHLHIIPRHAMSRKVAGLQFEDS